MTTQIRLAAFVLLTTGANLIAQGSLTPPGPPSSSMKTLTQVEPRRAIESAPFSITESGSYYLATNLVVGLGTDAITVGANDVTLDLNGFAIVGPGSGGTGVRALGAVTNLTVRNGVIRKMGLGVTAFDSKVTVQGLTVSENYGSGLLVGSESIIRDSSILKNGAYGLASRGNSIIDRCVVSGNYSFGIWTSNSIISGCIISTNNNNGINGPWNFVSDCSASYNRGVGINQNKGASIVKCTVKNNYSYGIYVGQGRVEDCLVSENGEEGIVAGDGSLVLNNTLINNNTRALAATNASISIYWNSGRVEGNHIVYGTNYGLLFYGGALSDWVIARNTFVGNPARVIAGSTVNSDVGPIGRASTATSPWANISN